jgi:hypothetical protein
VSLTPLASWTPSLSCNTNASRMCCAASSYRCGFIKQCISRSRDVVTYAKIDAGYSEVKPSKYQQKRQPTSTSSLSEPRVTLHEYTPDLVRVPYSNIVGPRPRDRCSPWSHQLCCIATNPVRSLSKLVRTLAAISNDLHQVEQPAPSGNNPVPSHSPATCQLTLSHEPETAHLVGIQ